MRNSPEQQRQVWASYFRALRAATGLSTRSMADRIGANPATIWRWESGRSKPESPAVPERIADLFAVPIEEVLSAAGLRPSAEPPEEPSRRVERDVEVIVHSDLPERVKRELIEHVLQQRKDDEDRRITEAQRMIRIAGGRVA